MVVVLQSLAQIKNMYDKLFEAVIGNCDTLVFLGGSEMETCKYISEKLGKTTIRTVSGNVSKGNKGSYSVGQNHAARDLMDPAEVAKMDNDMSIVIVRGVDPFYVHKYSLFEHPNFAMCGDASPENMVGDEFLDKYYTCTSKTTVEEDETEADNNEAKQIVEDGVIPGGFGGPISTEQMPCNNLQEMADAIGTEATEEAVADKLTAKGDEVSEGEGPVVSRDITNENNEEAADITDDYPEGYDFGNEDDPFGAMEGLNETAPVDATDFGMTDFDDSPENAGMDQESMLWLAG